MNANKSYEGMPWLDYDNHFRRAKASDRSATGSFAEVDSSIWTLHFGRAISKQVCKDCSERGHRSCKIDEVTETRAKDTLKTALSGAQPYGRPADRKGPNEADNLCWRYNGSTGCNVENAAGRPCRFHHICAKCKTASDAAPRQTSSRLLPTDG